MLFLRTLSCFILLVIAAVPTGCAHKKKSVLTAKFGPSQLREDATIFKNVSLAMHPAIGIYKSRTYYNKMFDTFIESLHDSLTEKQFRLEAKLVADKLHCGHTEVIYSNAYYRYINRQRLNYSPYIFLPVKDKVFMVANLAKKQDSTLKRGTEIIKINGIPVDSMLRYCRRFISTDGFNQTSKEHFVQLGFNSYYLTLFGRPDTFTVEYKDGKNFKSLKYAAFKPKSLPPIPLGPKDDSLFTKYKRAKTGYRFLDADKKTIVMKVSRFAHSKYSKAYRRIFRKLEKNGSQNLVIDLRNNGGGSLANAYRLLSYLLDSAQTQTLRTGIRNYPYKKYTSGNIWFKMTRLAFKLIGEKKTVHDTDNFVYTIKSRRRHHFNGKVFVLINGGSFSASCLVGAYLKCQNRATFIGEETGGAIEGCNAGITPYYKLPNTKIKVRMPAFRIVHDVVPAITGHGIMPDYKTEYTYKDLVSKRDLDLLKVKELLQIK